MIDGSIPYSMTYKPGNPKAGDRHQPLQRTWRKPKELRKGIAIPNGLAPGHQRKLMTCLWGCATRFSINQRQTDKPLNDAQIFGAIPVTARDASQGSGHNPPVGQIIVHAWIKAPEMFA